MKKFFIGALTLISLFFSIGCKADVRPKATVGDHPIYTLTFDSNNGSGDTTIQTGEYGRSIVLNENTFTYAYHTYTGWSTKPNSKLNSAVLYEDQDDFLVVNNQTLYAVWEPHDVRIKFYFSNSGTNLGTPMDDYTFAACLGGKLPNCTFALEGKGFRGWATNPGSTTVVYKDGQNIPAGFFESSENGMKTVSLYAVWETPDYWVTFYPNGGTGSAIKQGFFIGEKQPLLPCTFTKTDYVLKGWSTTSSPSVDASIDYYPEEEITVTGSKSLYAVWSQHKTVIKYVANGGEGSMANTEFFYSTGTTIRYNSFTRDHYTFKGWNTKSDGSGISYSSGEKVTLSTRVDEIILYAQWDIQKYTLTYFFNKPTPETTYSGSMTNTTVEYGQTVVVQENKFYCEHYTFQGFNTKADGSGKTIAVGTQLALTDDVGNVILYAQWKAKQYTITYHSNLNTYYNYTKDFSQKELKDTVTTQKYYYGDKVTLERNYGFTDTIIRRENGKETEVLLPYNFRGWGNSAEATYVNESEIACCNWGDKQLYGIYYYKNGPLAVYLANYPDEYKNSADLKGWNDRYFGYASSGKFSMTKLSNFDRFINIGFARTSATKYAEFATGSRGSASPAEGTYTRVYENSSYTYYYYKPTYFYGIWFKYYETSAVKGSNTFQYDLNNVNNKTRVYGMKMGLMEVTNEQYYQVMGSYTYPTTPNRPHIFSNYEAYYFIDKLNYLAGYDMQYFLAEAGDTVDNTNIPKVDDKRWIYYKGSSWYSSLTSDTHLYCARNLDSFRIPDEYEWLYMANGTEYSGSYQNYQMNNGFLYAGQSTLDKYGYYSGNSSSTLYDVGRKQSTLNQMSDVCGNLSEIVHYNGLYNYITWNKNGNYTSSNRPFATRVYATITKGTFYSKAYGGSYKSSKEDCQTVYGNCAKVTATSNNSSTLGLRMMRQLSWKNYLAN